MTQVGQTGRFATTVGPGRDPTRTNILVPPLPPASTRVQVAFMVVLGLFGWAGLLLAFFLPGFAPRQPQLGGLVPFALFLLVVVATRSMAFRLFSEAVVSL